ncbi:MAG TPA: DUF6498-containing protein, partial [Candidatus Acidoferrum sp.]|nr:DUF6498-containing protein [Candidatus Acidoferrum sp.]
VRFYRTSSGERSFAALLIANLIPLAGVVFFGWSLGTTVLDLGLHARRHPLTVVPGVAGPYG